MATIRLLHAPPERWHPSPAFLYAELSGPLLDVGPYTVSTAVELFGPVRRVTALATRVRETGTAVDGSSFEIVEPTRVSAVLEHDAGVLTTVTVTFDANGPARFGVEVHGSDGTLLGGDPNGFDGPVTLTRHGERGRAARARLGVARQRSRARAAGSLPRRSRRHAATRERARSACTSSRSCWRSATLPVKVRLSRSTQPSASGPRRSKERAG